MEARITMSITVIGGGARSGKSRFALDLARQCGRRLAFIATARGEDGEMADRITRHREERGPEFTTFEESLAIEAIIAAESGQFDALVVDCLTLWLSNLLFARPERIEIECQRLIASAAKAPARVLLVTNEVGCGIVPENALARRFRDLAGRLNQQAAEAADEVHWMVFGIPLKVK
jgi:adenosylcobinamide kinase/adenosylcobinamide-phosphate guanylyltransferase